MGIPAGSEPLPKGYVPPTNLWHPPKSMREALDSKGKPFKKGPPKPLSFFGALKAPVELGEDPKGIDATLLETADHALTQWAPHVPETAVFFTPRTLARLPGIAGTKIGKVLHEGVSTDVTKSLGRLTAKIPAGTGRRAAEKAAKVAADVSKGTRLYPAGIIGGWFQTLREGIGEHMDSQIPSSVLTKPVATATNIGRAAVKAATNPKAWAYAIDQTVEDIKLDAAFDLLPGTGFNVLKKYITPLIKKASPAVARFVQNTTGFLIGEVGIEDLRKTTVETSTGLAKVPSKQAVVGAKVRDPMVDIEQGWMPQLYRKITGHEQAFMEIQRGGPNVATKIMNTLAKIPAYGDRLAQRIGAMWEDGYDGFRRFSREFVERTGVPKLSQKTSKVTNAQVIDMKAIAEQVQGALANGTNLYKAQAGRSFDKAREIIPERAFNGQDRFRILDDDLEPLLDVATQMEKTHTGGTGLAAVRLILGLKKQTKARSGAIGPGPMKGFTIEDIQSMAPEAQAQFRKGVPELFTPTVVREQTTWEGLDTARKQLSGMIHSAGTDREQVKLLHQHVSNLQEELLSKWAGASRLRLPRRWYALDNARTRLKKQALKVAPGDAQNKILEQIKRIEWQQASIAARQPATATGGVTAAKTVLPVEGAQGPASGIIFKEESKQLIKALSLFSNARRLYARGAQLEGTEAVKKILESGKYDIETMAKAVMDPRNYPDIAVAAFDLLRKADPSGHTSRALAGAHWHLLLNQMQVVKAQGYRFMGRGRAPGREGGGGLYDFSGVLSYWRELKTNPKLMKVLFPDKADMTAAEETIGILHGIQTSGLETSLATSWLAATSTNALAKAGVGLAVGVAYSGGLNADDPALALGTIALPAVAKVFSTLFATPGGVRVFNNGWKALLKSPPGETFTPDALHALGKLGLYTLMLAEGNDIDIRKELGLEELDPSQPSPVLGISQNPAELNKVYIPRELEDMNAILEQPLEETQRDLSEMNDQLSIR